MTHPASKYSLASEISLAGQVERAKVEKAGKGKSDVVTMKIVVVVEVSTSDLEIISTLTFQEYSDLNYYKIGLPGEKFILHLFPNHPWKFLPLYA
jgi:hypothetical protein